MLFLRQPIGRLGLQIGYVVLRVEIIASTNKVKERIPFLQLK